MIVENSYNWDSERRFHTRQIWIEEAKRRLADPKMAREQIVSHAFSLGYASLAPFNRAFRERVGISPTEYREQVLSDAVTGTSLAS